MISSNSSNKILLFRIASLFILVIHIFKILNNLGISQLEQPIFLELKADRVLWLLDFLNILTSILQNPNIAILFDILLIILPLITLFYPQGKYLSILLFITCSLYYFSINSSSTHHEHNYIAILLISFLMIFKDKVRYNLVFEFTRFYTCFIFSSAAFWKIGRGTFWQESQFQNILRVQHSELLALDSKNSVYFKFIDFIINNYEISNLLWLFAIILQLSFLIGFFTKKYDHILLLNLLIFILTDFILMNICFFEYIILSVFFMKKFKNDRMF
jgi:hypothetical protein